MQTSTNHKPNQNFALLLQGPSKSGKSTFCACFFPKVYILDADNNLNGAFNTMNKLKEQGLVPKDKEVLYDSIHMFPDGKVRPPEERWTALTNFIKDAVLDPRIETIVLDSLTNIVQILMEHILANSISKQSIAKEKVMEIQHWQPFQTLLMKLVIFIRSSGKKLIFICHEELVTDEITKVIQYRINMPSRLQHSFGALFSDCWRCDAGEKDGKFVNQIRTLPNARVQGLGNTLGLPMEFSLSWKEFNEYLTGVKK